MSAPARPVTELPRSVPVGVARRTLRAIRRFRTSFIFGALLVLFVGLVARLVSLQIVHGDDYRQAVARRQTGTATDRPIRGTIYDRHGRPLAVSRLARLVAVDAGRKSKDGPFVVEDPVRFSATVSEILGGTPTPAQIRDRIRRERDSGSPSRFLVLRKNIDDPRVISRLDETRVEGMVVKPSERRDYPNGDWAEHVLGKTAIRNPDRPLVGGEDGIENALDRELSGQAVAREFRRDGRGERFSPGLPAPGAGATGHDVWLTLDLVVQGYCEEALDRLCEEWGPRGAVAVVLDPATGDVLAMAVRPRCAQNGLATANLAIQGTYEPGSIFKPFTVAAALEAGLVGADERLPLPRERTFTIAGASRTVHDVHQIGDESDGLGTLFQLISHSSNTGAADLAARLKAAGTKALLASLDLANPTGVGLPKEQGAKGLGGYWDVCHHLGIGFGQGFNVTPLRLAASFAAFARQDLAPVQPRIVLGVGDTGLPPRPPLQSLVTSPAHRDLLRRSLAAVVTEGTGSRTVSSEKYAIAGKTGTAKHPTQERYMSSGFVGYAPADDPRIVVLVLAAEPAVKRSGGTDGAVGDVKPYGAVVAGPAVRTIVERTLEEYLGLPPAGAPTAPAEAGVLPASQPRAGAEEGR